MQLPEEEVRARLVRENPWWAQAEAPRTVFRDLHPRPYLAPLARLVQRPDVRRAVVVLGPRRVGKTVLVHHVIDEELASGRDPRRICFVHLDHPIYTHRSLENLIEIYRTANGLEDLDGSLIAFDEIQYRDRWEVELKRLVDDFPRTTFVASGSAAAALKRMSAESGAGRFTLFELPPLSFYEFLLLSGQLDLAARDDRSVDLRWRADDLDALNRALDEYLGVGGYPEAVVSRSVREDPGRYIKSDIIDKVLLRDLPSLYGIQNTQELNALFTYVAFQSGREVSLEKLSNQSGVSKQTIHKYIDYLEAAFLMTRMRRVRADGRRFERDRTFKVYLTNPSLRAALFTRLDPDDRDHYGHLVETGLACQWLGRHLDETRYVRDRNRELDFVRIEPGSGRVLRGVEVKWSDRHGGNLTPLAGALDLCDRLGLDRLTVTSRTTRESVEARIGLRVDVVPAAELLLSEGAAAFE